MFGKKKDNKGEEISEVAGLSADQDMIVHNMPTASRLSGASFGETKNVYGSGLAPASQKQNFKTVGLVIIGGGIIVIGAIIYLSYRFIISPTAGKNQPVSTVPAVVETKKVATASPETLTPAMVPTTTVLIATTSAAIEMQPSATTTLMGEESTGRDGSDLPPLLDSDSDGLIDEEEYLLGTSATSTDTDGDKYGDSAELAKGYDPAGSGKLSANANIAKYQNKTYGYSMLYPKAWEAKSLAEDATAIFVAPDDSLVQISVQENQDKAGILSWYQSSFPDATATYDQLLSADGWDGIMGTDNLNFYLTDSKHNNIYVISYIPAVSGRLAYSNIFKAMIASFFAK